MRAALTGNNPYQWNASAPPRNWTRWRWRPPSPSPGSCSAASPPQVRHPYTKKNTNYKLSLFKISSSFHLYFYFTLTSQPALLPPDIVGIISHVHFYFILWIRMTTKEKFILKFLEMRHAPHLGVTSHQVPFSWNATEMCRAGCHKCPCQWLLLKVPVPTKKEESPWTGNSSLNKNPKSDKSSDCKKALVRAANLTLIYIHRKSIWLDWVQFFFFLKFLLNIFRI